MGWQASKPGAAVVARPRQQRFDRRGVVRRSADGASSLQQLYFIHTAAAVAGAATAQVLLHKPRKFLITA